MRTSVFLGIGAVAAIVGIILLATKTSAVGGLIMLVIAMAAVAPIAGSGAGAAGGD